MSDIGHVLYRNRTYYWDDLTTIEEARSPPLTANRNTTYTDGMGQSLVRCYWPPYPEKVSGSCHLYISLLRAD